VNESEVLRQYEGTILKYSFHIKAEAPMLDNDDVAQELRLAVLRATRSWRDGGGASFNTYVHTAMHNARRDMLKKAFRNPPCLSLYVEDDEGNEVERSGLAYEEDVDTYAALSCLTDRLTPFERSVLRLMGEGRSNRSIEKENGTYKTRKARKRICSIAKQTLFDSAVV
jgi:DNA-directed RNA polymerase specialized sigma24 family protein